MISLDSKGFLKDMNNIIEYSVGFLNGVDSGKVGFMDNLGKTAIEAVKQFIDTNARIDPELLAHMYEWYEVGTPEGRLYELSYSVTGAMGLTINSSFKQSTTIKTGSSVPFYDKARIMEQGIPVTITPKRSDVLAFETPEGTVFTKAPVRVENPGGAAAQGGYASIFHMFFDRYFTQSFIVSSGIFSHLENPVDYKNNLQAGKTGGKATGFRVGYQWISRGGLLQ